MSNALDDLTVEQLAKTVLSAKKKGLFRLKEVFRAHAPVSSDQLDIVEKKIRVALPGDLRQWLLAVGYGDIADEISFRAEWFAAIEQGELSGGAIFAQDVLGNFYAFDASSGGVYCLARSDATYSKMGNDFLSFMKELIRRDYRLGDWLRTVESAQYSW